MDSRKKTRQERGTAIVEAAIVLPLLLLLTMGAIEYGWLFLKAQQITNAARHGARVRVRPAADDQEAFDAIQSLMTAAGLGAKGGIWDASITINAAVDDERPTVTVKIWVIEDPPMIHDILLIDAPDLLPVPSTIKAEVTMAMEGAG